MRIIYLYNVGNRYAWVDVYHLSEISDTNETKALFGLKGVFVQSRCDFIGFIIIQVFVSLFFSENPILA